MKTDLLLIPMSARYRDMRAAAVAAEETGFDGLWTWDHLRDPDRDSGPGTPEAWTVLTALAEATRRIMLGPLVLNVANRHPGVLANMAATLQAVSGGRLLLENLPIRQYSVGDGVDCVCGFERQPVQRELMAKPCHLPLGELASADFDQLDRFGKRALVSQMFHHLAVPERLHCSLVLGQTAL